MENNEKISFEEEPKLPVKESPFADSPYVMEAPAQEETAQQEVAPVQPAPRKKGRGKKVLKTLLCSVLIIALVAASCGITALFMTGYVETQKKQMFAAMSEQINRLEQLIEDNSFTGQGNSVSGTGTADGLTPGQVYAQNKKSVVAIYNLAASTSGSGFIISENGYIVTNHHVVENATTLTVITSGGDEYNATLVGYEDRNDLALLKIDGADLPYVKLGSSDDLIVGDQVVAIGNALGELTNTLTVGYISAKDRDVSTDGSIINMLQTDAAINKGNSGGPLFNMKGEVIGITTAKYVADDIEGIGFAIPIDDVKGMITELIENGFISTPYLGITITTQADGMGVYVRQVSPGTPAADAGMKAGDIIVGLGDYTVTSMTEFDKVMRNFKAHDTTSIFVYRNRQVLELTITFGEKNQPVVQPSGSAD